MGARAPSRPDEVLPVTWALPPAEPPLQVERAGIIASFILNAAMIPGWPPQKPFEAADPDSFVRTLLPDAAQPPSEADLIAFLRERSVREALLARLRTLLAALRPARRRHLLQTLAACLTALHAALGELAAEIERLGEEASEREGARERLRI